MNRRPGLLAPLKSRLCPTWAALGAVVLLGFLATSSSHDHADDGPGNTAIHCPLVVAPLSAAGQAADVEIDRDPPVRLDAWEGCTTRPAAPLPASVRARAPPAKTLIFA